MPHASNEALQGDESKASSSNMSQNYGSFDFGGPAANERMAQDSSQSQSNQENAANKSTQSPKTDPSGGT